MQTPPPQLPTSFDYAIAGGGLQAALLVLAIRARSPRASIVVVERDDRLGGNHTWCFHASDASRAAHAWIEPALAHRWGGYDVRFPGVERTIDDAYLCMTPESLEPAVEEALSNPGDRLIRGVSVAGLSRSQLTLESGEVFDARLVIDARGPAAGVPEDAGFQKFVGQELELSAPHGLTRPVLMDATVDQSDGFRFFYLLPFAGDRLLVEDTRFTNSPDLDREAYRVAIEDYCAAAGWEVRRVAREEAGVLPMPWASPDPGAEGGVVQAGYRGGWFHPGTGYSVPVAVRVAEAIAARNPDRVREQGLPDLRREHGKQAEYCQLLNRLMFRWYPPEMRWNIFARFYRMPVPLIRRFYALRMRASDQARLLVGRPPRGLSVGFRVGSGGSA
jgi:lycopene beta-cyclase